MADRWTRLAELAVHGANVQPDQILMVSAELGQEELARAVAAAGYGRGAKFVDVVYFDPHLKRARVAARRPGDARLRAGVVRRAAARRWPRVAARASRSPGRSRRTCWTISTRRSSGKRPAAVDEGDEQDRSPTGRRTGRSSRARTPSGPRSSIPSFPADEAMREALGRARARAAARRARRGGGVGGADGGPEHVGRATRRAAISTRSSCAGRAPS